MTVRIKVRCINWWMPLAPHAASFVCFDGFTMSQQTHDTWQQAMTRANEIAVRYRAWEATQAVWDRALS